MLFAAALTVAQAQGSEQGEVVDPPARVGGISLLAGPVSLLDLSSGSREEALLNWPITAGWRLETGPNGRAEVRIGSTALQLDDETTVDFVRLDDQFMQLAVLRGSVSLRLRSRETLTELELLTQRERIVFDDLGRYRIDVDRSPGITAVTSFGGRARIVSGNSSFVVAADQRGEVTAPPRSRFGLSPAQPDRFDTWVAERDARDDSLNSTAYVSRETTGVEQLDQYGDWRVVEDHGAVWFPRATIATWAPYRFGRWVWLHPWGWTWVDEAPWGFAPLHYGRWIVIGSSWGWVPGRVVARPVFAPALVAWYGVPVAGRGPVGWFPLGPREPYVPAHRHSPRYLRVVNVQNVPQVDRLTIVQTPKYVNRHPDRSTWVADDRFGRPEPVSRGQRPPPSEWQQYIARPQPPANVPNTKRRQGNEIVTPATPSPMPPRPADTGTRPQSPAAQDSALPREPGQPRAVEAPSAVEAPRGMAPANGQQHDPRYQPPVDPRAAPGRPYRPEDGERRAAPRPQPVSPAPTPQSPSQPAQPVPQPRVDQVPAGDGLPRQPRQPGRQMPAPTFRPDDVGSQDNRRYSPRGPEVPQAPRPQQPQIAPTRPAPPVIAPAQVAPAQVAPVQVSPARVAPPQHAPAAPAQAAPPTAPPQPAPVRPPQPPRDDSGGGPRQGRPPYEASR